MNEKSNIIFLWSSYETNRKLGLIMLSNTLQFTGFTTLIYDVINPSSNYLKINNN